MAVSVGGFIALDCADPVELGEFWANMLGGTAIAVSPDIVAIQTPWVWLTALASRTMHPRRGPPTTSRSRSTSTSL